MFCTNCGKEFEGQFCPNCGNKVNDDSSTLSVSVPTQSGEATIIFKPTKMPFLIPGLKKSLIKVDEIEKICKFRQHESFRVKAGNVNIFACTYQFKLFLFVKINCFKIDKNIKLEGGKTYEIIYKVPTFGIVFFSKGQLEINEVKN